MQKPKNIDEFLDIADQTIFEVDDLVSSAADEGEEDEFTRYLPVYQQLLAELRMLHGTCQRGQHIFAAGHAKWKSRLPVFSLIEVLNAAHRRGFADVR